ncbi:MAG: hypothetical protein AAF362_16200 [Pseudomonadota bacterium]
MWRFPITIAAILVTTNLVAAGDYEDGIKAYDGADYPTAFQHLKQAADDGNPDAQALIGYMYANGQGVRIDYISAYQWYELSAAQGNRNAAENRSNIAKNMTADQITEAKRLAQEWKPPQ